MCLYDHHHQISKKRVSTCTHHFESELNQYLLCRAISKFLKKVDPPIPPNELDKIIKAELPTNNPLLRQKIKKYMTHSASHLKSEHSRCNHNGTCLYGFPHPLTAESWFDAEGRFHPRRRTEDDLMIASHNPELIDELNCHIFFDVVFTVFCFMYLYKYFYKGPDHALFHVYEQGHDASDKRKDEIQDYVRGRYLSAPEAAWRILGYHISEKHPPVSTLSIHLPGQNIHKFNEGPNSTSLSSLLHYFHRPKLPLFDDILYTEYFEQYCFYSLNQGAVRNIDDEEYMEEPIQGKARQRVQPRRRNTGLIARIQTVSPMAGELFYLRCLLLHRPARNFRDLRKFDDKVYNTFHEAAIHCGLFQTEDEGWYAMNEAEQSFQTPRQIRFLFSRIILEGYPAKPLWDRFQCSLTYDWTNVAPTNETGINRALQEISLYIEESGRSLADFGLPQPILRSPEVSAEIDVFDGREHELDQEVKNMTDAMDADQLEIYSTLYACITEDEEIRKHRMSTFFIEGKPGRGKTFVANVLATKLRSEGYIVLIVATTALAATLYERGRTAHSLFRIPVTEVSHLLT